MNAPNPLPASTSAGDPRPHEPSMEEILASIRRIISDDQSLPARVREPSAPASVAHSETAAPGSSEATPAAALVVETPRAPQPEFELMERHGVIAAPQFAGPDGPTSGPASDTLSTDGHVSAEPPTSRPAESLSEAEETVPYEATTRLQVAGDPDLPLHLDAEPADAYFDAPIEHEPAEGPSPGLFSTATDNSVTSAFNMLAATRFADNSDELMNLARDMIRPLLKTWLDDNLPSMVERMVRQEIERVARGGR